MAPWPAYRYIAVLRTGGPHTNTSVTFPLFSLWTCTPWNSLGQEGRRGGHFINNFFYIRDDSLQDRLICKPFRNHDSLLWSFSYLQVYNHGNLSGAENNLDHGFWICSPWPTSDLSSNYDWPLNKFDTKNNVSGKKDLLGVFIDDVTCLFTTNARDWFIHLNELLYYSMTHYMACVSWREF